MKNREQELLTVLTASLTYEQKCDLDEITEDHDAFLEIDSEINIIYTLKNGKFDIIRNVDDTHDAAVEYINREYPDLDEIIFSNLDFDGVEMDMGGRLTSVGYIMPLKEGIEQIYNGDNADRLLRELGQRQTYTQTQEIGGY